MQSRTSWREKLEKPQELRVVDIPPGKGTMLIPTPELVDRLIRKVPKGKLVTVAELGRKMADDGSLNPKFPEGPSNRLAICAAKGSLSSAKEGTGLEAVRTKASHP